MKQQISAATALAAALALPAVADAHPSVYKSEAKTYTGTYPGGTLDTVTRYAVTNHGFTQVLTETNGVEGKGGVVGFNLVPGGTYRAAKSTAEILDEGGTGVQAHATCTGGTSALDGLAQVAGWQGGNQPAPTTQQPFFNYVPFQVTSAGLADEPEDWIPTLLAAGFTTADFASAASAQAACAAKGGTYVPADTVTTTSAALSEGLTEPLEAEVQGLEADKAALSGEIAGLKTQGASLSGQLASAQAELASARGQVASLLLAATPIKLAVGSTKARTVAASGQTVGVTAAPLKAVTVKLTISDAQARKLKLASTLLGRKTVTTAADGTASVKVKVSKAAAKALRAAKGTVSTTVEATSGDRFATAKSRLSR